MIKTENSPDFEIKEKTIKIYGESKITDPAEAREFYKQIIIAIQRDEINKVIWDMKATTFIDEKYINQISETLISKL